ncbi:bifunctional sugar phosphate isomerase/epimerase/4-hydroxyphenylpyruvate dioxygenase family protein [Beijerinckia mobilis]|uniref:bifunctional sugar phosphate isomerase/epimerase/4-hydroxyphenylpyruvate dioxygenase family protein n=1 Tax=Beijerinckia mobilis TaxID=231434 RepID=UPI000553A582|nr:sugar phosphate isomerase/epimerase and 4-hydroxyphenylpyruvate domain-containing protein [Beijerinckia mobilis]
MKMSIATVSLSGDLIEKLDAIAHAGFDAVEIFEADFLAFNHTPADVGKMVRDRGLTISVFQPFRDFEGLPEPLRTKAFERAERKFDVMAELGTEQLLVCSNVSPYAQGGIDRAVEDLRELGERAAKRGLRIGFEALAWGRFINDYRDAWEIVRRVDHPGVGLVLDSFHVLSRGLELDSISAIPKEKLFLVQLADAPRLNLDLLSWSRHFRNMPGQGDLPLLPFIQAVQSTGYAGVLSLEIFNDQFRAGSARQVAIDGRRSLIYLMGQLADVDGLSAIDEQVYRLPERARCKNIEFIEFAVDENSLGRLEKVLKGLGFRKFAHHRTKNVVVWSQGGINIVLNCEPESFAHSFYITHGFAVCAICLSVDDAHAALERARKLLAVPFPQAVVPGQIEIPAIRGVGNSLIYFIDQKGDLQNLWSIDFEQEGMDTAPEEDVLVNIDHISQSTEYDEMLSWLLFYTSIFDVEKTSGLDIADPAGLVRSQVVQNEEGTLRIAINGAQSLRTMAGRFLNEFFGSGTQHIAFATNDIFAAAKQMKANGLTTLPIPDNYYDDLMARFDFDEVFVGQLANHGIMYDRDETGEYFQIYSHTFPDGFFFEIVERRHYTGFGAANAPIRLAVQTRLAPHLAVPKH